MKVIKCLGLVAGLGGPIDCWLSSYDNRTGESTWTHKPDKAMRFEDFYAALQMWKSVHELEPVRPDGKPNRPLTAFTVEIMEEP